MGKKLSSIKNLDPKTHERLKEINAELKAIEEKFYQIAVRIDEILQYEMHCNVDGMDCYDFHLEIQCYNADENAEPICLLSDGLTGISNPCEREFFIGDEINHNTCSSSSPMKSEHHCWLYHCLYDHTALSWEEIASIQTFWTEIRVLRQYELIHL